MEFVWVINESERSIGFIHDKNEYGRISQSSEILGVASKWKEEN